MSSPDPCRDVMAHTDARALLERLDRAGVQLRLSRGNICSPQSARIAPEDVAALRLWKPIVMTLLLALDERTMDRLARLKAGYCRQDGEDEGEAPRCYACSERLPRRRSLGRCGWCGIAARLDAGCPLSTDVLWLFDPALVGDQPTKSGKPLPFDVGAPAA